MMKKGDPMMAVVLNKLRATGPNQTDQRVLEDSSLRRQN